MNIQWPKYEHYKDSGVDWLGEIPASWDILPGLSCLYESKEKNIGNMESTVLSLSYGQIIIKPEEKLTGLVPESFETYQIIEPNDIIIRTTDLQNDHTSLRTGISKNRGIITSAYLNLRPKKNVNAHYLHYLLHAFDLLKVFYGMGSGLRQNLDFRDFKRLKLSIPTNEEQDNIVAFLDQKTAEIDQAIAKKQRLIELLKEHKTILINRAVTQGLNPDVPMKDSGVEWIGKIPAHWRIIPNRFVFNEINDRSKNGFETHLSMSQKLGLIPANEVAKSLESESYEGAKLVNKYDLVLNRLKAHLAVFSSSIYNGLVSPDYSVFRLRNSTYSVAFFENLYKTPAYLGEFNRMVKGIVVGFLRLYSDDFNAIPCIVPPAHEQHEIVAAIRHKEDEFKALSDLTEREIEMLVEFKQTLIAHAVTGKIKV